MSTELSNGVIIPEEYSDDWYDEMSINLRKLNDVITAASDNATDIQRLDTDKANQSDLTALTSRVYQNETDIIALQTAVSGALKREIVQTLPTEDISTTTIYMIRNSESSGTNIYDEYMYINSQWELIGTSATDFSNYYTKNETDNLLSAKANQTDLTSLSGRVTQNETDITALQTAVSGALKREIVQSLPTQDISTTTIYMIRNTTTSGDNIYDEYMYINSQWELIGTSATDFSNYYTKTEIDTLLSDKATDSDVVHKSGNETVSGKKTFSDDLTIYNNDSSQSTKSLIISSSKIQVGDTSNSDSFGINFNAGLSYIASISASKDTSGTQNLRFSVRTKDNSNNFITSRVRLKLFANGNSFFEPDTDNAVSLGSSSYKFKDVQTYKVNGVEPSSLSLPSSSGTIDISSYITDLTGATVNNYTPLANGYIVITCNANDVDYIKMSNNLDFVSVVDNTNNQFTSGILGVWQPCIVGIGIQIRIKSSALKTAKFIPCQGNI